MLWVVTCPRGGVGANPNFRRYSIHEKNGLQQPNSFHFLKNVHRLRLASARVWISFALMHTIHIMSWNAWNRAKSVFLKLVRSRV